tara:strand:+ start:134 stop:955 length:822 start_codon:yes stop_codon:yes gene_type:complete
MNLLEYKFDKYTTTGNDGIIEKILQIVDINNGFFVEFGAWDGIKGSNCRKLFEEGWSGIFIEADPRKYAALKENYRDQQQIICINSFVDREDNKFDNLVDRYVDNDIDFCSIDIDGLDLEIFETFKQYMPKIICIEGGQMLEPFYERVPESISKNNVQQSLKVMVDTFNSRGYKILCTYQDTFFIKEEYYHLFDISDNIMELYLDGLLAHHRRIPWIKSILRKNNLNNKLINYILQKTNYYKYGYSDRKRWAIQEKEITFEVINSLKEKLKNQ